MSILIPKAKLEEIHPAKPDNRSNYYLTDFFNNYDEVENKIKAVDDLLTSTNILRSLIRYFNFRPWLFYLLSGMLVAVICWIVDVCSSRILLQRTLSIQSLNYFQGLFVWMISAFLLATISTGICHTMGQEAQGAGVAEIKCILSGARMAEYLKSKILFAKMASLITAIGAGLAVGKVGPCLHLGGLSSYNLAKIPYFDRIRSDSVLKLQIIMIGSAVGLACAFGTPIAGVIAGVELIGKINTIRTIWILYVSLFFSMLVLKALNLFGLSPQMSTQIHDQTDLSAELPLFAILGILCGIVSALFVSLSISYQVYRFEKNTLPLFRTRYCYTWVAILITSFLQYNFNFLRIGDKVLLGDFFSDNPLPSSKWSLSSANPMPLLDITALFLFKFLLIFLGITCPLSGGVFGPFMILGALIGRLFAELCSCCYPLTNIGRFAIAGSAALSATATRFLAMTLVIIELTEDIKIAFPIMITVLFSFATGNMFTKTFFYSTIEWRKLPYVPKLMRKEIYQLKARNIMQKPKLYLHARSNFFDVFEFFARGKNVCLADYIPVTLDVGDMTFVGTLKTDNLKAYFMEELRTYKRKASGKWIQQITSLMKSYCEIDEEAIIDAKEMCRLAKKRLEMHNLKQEKKGISLLSGDPDELDFSFLRAKLAQEEEAQEEQDEKTMFFARLVDFANSRLKFDRSPISINLWTYLSKVHFLFIALGVSTIFVVDRGVLKGVIKRNHFLGLNNQKEYRN